MTAPSSLDISAGLVYQLLWSPRKAHAIALVGNAPNGPGALELYETTRWDRVRTWPVQLEPETTSIAWSKDGDRFAVTVDEQTIQLLSLDAAAPLATRRLAEPGYIMRIAWHPRSDALAAAFFPHEGAAGVPHVALWRGGQELPTVVPLRSDPGGTFAWAGWSPSGEHLGVIFTKQLSPTFDRVDNRLLLLEPEHDGSRGLRLVAERALPSGSITLERPSEGWSSDGSRFAAAIFDEHGGGVRFVDPRSDRPGPTWRPDRGNTLLRGAAWAPGRSVVATTDGAELLLIDAERGELVQRLPSRFAAAPERFTETGPAGDLPPMQIDTAGFTHCVEWSPDGRYLAAGNHGGIRIFDLGANALR